MLVAIYVDVIIVPVVGKFNNNIPYFFLRHTYIYIHTWQLYTLVKMNFMIIILNAQIRKPVSYTHLDVYKRQVINFCSFC